MPKRKMPQDGQFSVKRKWYYTEVENAVLEDELDTHDKLTYVMLCKFANHEDGKCFPSYSTLMKLVGCGRERLSKSLTHLEQRGWIIRQKENGVVNLYFLPGKRVDTSSLDEQVPVRQGNYPSSLDEQVPVRQANTNYNQYNNNHLTIAKNSKRKTKEDKFKDFSL